VLHYRQGLLAEAKDIGQSSPTSKGQSLMELSCSIVVQVFSFGRGEHLLLCIISYNWSFLSPSLFFSFLVMWVLCNVVKNVGLSLHHEASRTSFSLYAVDVLLGHDVPCRHVLFHALRVAGGFARGQRRTGFGDAALEAVFVEFLSRK
jgi:hypothetical protein